MTGGPLTAPRFDGRRTGCGAGIANRSAGAVATPGRDRKLVPT